MNVFLQSQTGIDVGTIKAPTNGTGFKVFKNRGLRKYSHTKVPTKIPERMTPPKRSLLGKMRADVSVASADSTVSLSTINSSASLATKASIAAKAGRPKKLDIRSPQAFLHKELKRRGYNLKSYATLDSGYYSHPNEHQLASYGRIVTKAMYQPNNTKVLEALLDCGVSPNACNKFGESIVHLVCRRGHCKLLEMLMDTGCTIKVSDDYGRTPLHDACWQARPNFEVVKLMFQTDKHLVRMRDIRGSTPLYYVKEENFAKWNEFLASIMDEFWPRRNDAVEGVEAPPPMTMKRPNSMPLRVPHLLLTNDQIAMLANGDMTIEEAQILGMDDDSTVGSEASEVSYDSDDSSICDTDSEFDNAELDEVCMLAGNCNIQEYCNK